MFFFGKLVIGKTDSNFQRNFPTHELFGGTYERIGQVTWNYIFHIYKFGYVNMGLCKFVCVYIWDVQIWVCVILCFVNLGPV